ncbi:hypothetical protein WBP07_13055 [Novosphingobium sp. BL-8A]|uniref:hypothetical protein n=1 Tax=Novosphingobium sp. BL-8A TaxID=3127639 RepID=UPI0037579E3B
MKGIVRTGLAAILGAALFYALPRPGILAATQELIGFLALLMAGLLPAMTLTATILRGEGISARRVEEYAGALRLQLRFWAVLFAASAIATAAISFAKVFSATGVSFSWSIRSLHVTEGSIVGLSLILAGASIGVVLQRLYPAYQGLQSLLTLNVNMAKSEAMSRDRALRDGLSLGLDLIRNPPEYGERPMPEPTGTPV